MKIFKSDDRIAGLCNTLYFLIFSVFFASSAYATPGGVGTNLSLWLKADAGVTEAAGTVSAWADQSPNGFSATNSAGDMQTEPTVSSTFINFNPSIEFDGLENGLDLGSDFIFSENDGLSIYAIASSDDSTSIDDRDFIVDFGFFSTEGYGLAWKANNALGYLPAIGGAGSGGAFSTAHTYGSQNVLLEMNVDFGATKEFYVNNTQLHSSAITLTELSAANIREVATHDDGGPVTIGRMAKTSVAARERRFTGRIAELIIYDNDMQASREQIQSYLAIKYGITLEAGTGYVNAVGIPEAVFTYDGVYESNVVGLAEDGNSTLNQKVSKSVNAGSVLTIATTSDFTSPNSDVARTGLGDGNYFMTAHNNSPVTLGTDFAGMANQLMSRVWRVEETGSVGDIHVAIPNTLSLGANPSVVVSSDSSFDRSDVIIQLTDDGTYYHATINPSDGELFTFGNAATSQQAIENYAENDGGPVPSVQDFAAIGVSGVDAGNIAAINAALADPDVVGSDANTPAEVQTIVDAVNSIIDQADGVITLPNTTPDSNDYAAIGVSGVTPVNVAAVNDAVAATADDGSGVDTPAEVQALIDAYLPILDQADGSAVPTPVVADFIALGITRVTVDNIDAVNAAIANTADDGSDVNTLIELQNIVDAVNNIIDQADGVITAPNTVPVEDDFVAIDVAGVTANNLDAVNASIANTADDGSDVDTPAEVQDIVDAVNNILDQADGIVTPPNTTPEIDDFLAIGITGVTAGNIDSVNLAIADTADDGSEVDTQLKYRQ